MARYSAPLADIRFALYDVLDVESLFKRLPGFETATRDVVDAVLDEAAKFTEQVLAPLNAGRRRGRLPLRRGDGERDDADGIQGSLREVRRRRLERADRAGRVRRPGPAANRSARRSRKCSTRRTSSWGNYPLLSHGATEALQQHGEEWQREAFLKPIVEGRWTGTMCLTEPHCGTDLGLLKAKAEPAGDGSYRDQRHEDLHHRRRARPHREHRAPGARAPAGCAGRRQGHLAVHRAEVQSRHATASSASATRVACGAIEHKMGIKALGRPA